MSQNLETIIQKLLATTTKQNPIFQTGKAITTGNNKLIQVNVGNKRITALSYNVSRPGNVTVFWDEKNKRYVAWEGNVGGNSKRTTTLAYRKTRPDQDYLWKYLIKVLQPNSIEGFDKDVTLDLTGYAPVGITNIGDDYTTIHVASDDSVFAFSNKSNELIYTPNVSDMSLDFVSSKTLYFEKNVSSEFVSILDSNPSINYTLSIPVIFPTLTPIVGITQIFPYTPFNIARNLYDKTEYTITSSQWGGNYISYQDKVSRPTPLFSNAYWRAPERNVVVSFKDESRNTLYKKTYTFANNSITSAEIEIQQGSKVNCEIIDQRMVTSATRPEMSYTHTSSYIYEYLDNPYSFVELFANSAHTTSLTSTKEEIGNRLLTDKAYILESEWPEGLQAAYPGTTSASKQIRNGSGTRTWYESSLSKIATPIIQNENLSIYLYSIDSKNLNLNLNETFDIKFNTQENLNTSSQFIENNNYNLSRIDNATKHTMLVVKKEDIIYEIKDYSNDTYDTEGRFYIRSSQIPFPLETAEIGDTFTINNPSVFLGVDNTNAAFKVVLIKQKEETVNGASSTLSKTFFTILEKEFNSIYVFQSTNEKTTYANATITNVNYTDVTDFDGNITRTYTSFNCVVNSIATTTFFSLKNISQQHTVLIPNNDFTSYLRNILPSLRSSTNLYTILDDNGNETVELAIAEVPTTTAPKTLRADIYRFNTATLKWERRPNAITPVSDLTAVSSFVSYHPDPSNSRRKKRPAPKK